MFTNNGTEFMIFLPENRTGWQVGRRKKENIGPCCGLGYIIRVGSLTPKMTVFGDRVLKEVSKFKQDHKDGVLIPYDWCP